eukprot:GHVR01125886.1.p1 GENE.GHVR01125886.1~~GHVR01125886.1.p1  ORF type:complete len:179 (+),score=33.53 GHVR01125886.1:72-539(+)
MTYITAGLGTVSATSGLTVSQGLAIASAVVSIGLTVGAFGTGAGARNASILAAVLSLGSAYAGVTAGASTSATLKLAMTTATTLVGMADTIETYEFNKEYSSKEDALEAENEAGEMYESELRFVYGDSYDYPVRYTCEKNPYDYIGKVYDDFKVS